MRWYIKVIFLTVAILLFHIPASLADNFGFTSAAKTYGVEERLLRAISWVESRHNANALGKNKNGSYDSGHMQINNSTWSKSLSGGYKSLATYPEYCTAVGAWILRQCKDRYPSENEYWDMVACYHTGTGIKDAPPNKKRLGLIYVNKVYKAMLRDNKKPLK